MVKLYRFANDKKEYWETWRNEDGSHTVHWGGLGTIGESKTVKSSLLRRAETIVQKDIDMLVNQGFQPLDIEDHANLIVEYAIPDNGTNEDIDKRYRLQDLMNEVLGWTGLGICDGGSIGNGTMEVCNLVVDFELAKFTIEQSLIGTEFADYTRIYDEDA